MSSFDKVIGYRSIKRELLQICDMIRNRTIYEKMGAHLPHGLLLYGAPGLGKSLLANCFMEECGLNTVTVRRDKGGDAFINSIAQAFAKAKKEAPSVLFLDDMDKFANEDDSRCDTPEYVAVQAGIDDVKETDVFVIATANEIRKLPDSLCRSGRFDRKIRIQPPTAADAEAIIAYYLKGRRISDSVNMKDLAKMMSYHSCAELETILNEAAIRAARENRPYINQTDIRAAFIKVGIGAEKKSRVISDKEKKITAYHESGHAILFHELEDVGPVYSVSIIPTGVGAAGYTMPLPSRDEMFATRGQMLHEIMVDFGGRIAEELILDDITTGASNDIQKATATARNMVTKYGMSASIGAINYQQEEQDVFLGYDLGHTSRNSEYMAGEIDKEVKAIIDRCYADARAIIMAHEDVLHASAKLLMEKEKITGEEFDALFHSDAKADSEENRQNSL